MGTTVGAIPEFTSDEVKEEAVETAPEQTPSVSPETEPITVPETPVETIPEGQEQPAEPPPANIPPDTAPDVSQKQMQGLMREREALLNEIKALRGTRREIKQEQIDKVEKQIDELHDLNPEDVSTVERILRSKGYVRQDEVRSMYYQSVQQEELDKFLDRYPEYKPDNDPNNIYWNSLQREFSLYRRPDDPRRIGDLLERAHRNVSRAPVTKSIEIKKQQVTVAGHGSGGVQRPPAKQSGTVLTETQRTELLRGGWTAEDIRKIEGN